MKIYLLTLSLIFVSQNLLADEQSLYPGLTPRKANPLLLRESAGDYKIMAPEPMDIEAVIRDIKMDRGISCEEFVSKILDENHLGKFQQPNPRKTFLYHYGHDSRNSLPTAEVKWIPGYKWKKSNLRKPHRTQTLFAASGSGNSEVDDVIKSPNAPLWHLTITDTEDEDAPKSTEIIPFGSYSRTYQFQVVNSECRLKSIETHFQPLGKNMPQPARVFDFHRCVGLIREFAGDLHRNRYKDSKNEMHFTTRRDVFTERCIQVVPYFAEMRENGEILHTRHIDPVGK